MLELMARYLPVASLQVRAYCVCIIRAWCAWLCTPRPPRPPWRPVTARGIHPHNPTNVHRRSAACSWRPLPIHTPPQPVIIPPPFFPPFTLSHKIYTHHKRINETTGEVLHAPGVADGGERAQHRAGLVARGKTHICVCIICTYMCVYGCMCVYDSCLMYVSTYQPPSPQQQTTHTHHRPPPAWPRPCSRTRSTRASSTSPYPASR